MAFKRRIRFYSTRELRMVSSAAMIRKMNLEDFASQSALVMAQKVLRKKARSLLIDRLMLGPVRRDIWQWLKLTLTPKPKAAKKKAA